MLTELIQLSERLELTGSEPFAQREIHWVIDLDGQGNLIGISPTTKTVKTPQGKVKEERGKQFPCPTFFYMKVQEGGAIVATAGGGNVPALLGIGRTIEVFGQEINEVKGQSFEVVAVSSDKDITRHDNFISLHQKFAEAFPNNVAASAVLKFLHGNPQLIPSQFFPPSSDSEKADKQAGKAGKKDNGAEMARLNVEYLTFRVARRLLLEDGDFIAWWTDFYNRQRQQVWQALPEGTDLLTAGTDLPSRLTKVFPHIAGIPNGGGYCPLASFDKEPSQSYGLSDMTAPARLENAEKAAAALNWLLREETTRLKLGSDLVAVFWAVDLSKPDDKPKTSPFGNLLMADPLQVRDFLRAPGKGVYQQLDHTEFYAAILSSPQSRVTVRNWHTATLPETEQHLRAYFAGINLASKAATEFSVLPVGLLADVTIAPRKKGDKAKPQPDTHIALFETALFGAPMPHKLLSKVLRRQSLELAKGADKKSRTEFSKRLTARTALIKLYFKSTKGVEMTPDKHSIENDLAYLCGRLLAMLDRIHEKAHEQSGGTNSSPANRVYGAASTTPALVFPQLCKLARHHLNKLGGGMARNLEFGVKKENRTDGGNEDFEGLAGIVARLLLTPDQQFPRTLSLEEQGRFAIGFYYERSLPLPKTRKNQDGASDAPGADETQDQKPKGANDYEQQ